MRLLLDHCVPVRLADALHGHEVSNAAEMGWERLRNGELLAAAGRVGFDALITVDQNLAHQQNLGMLPVAVVVIRSVSNDIAELTRLAPLVLETLRRLPPRRLVHVPAE